MKNTNESADLLTRMRSFQSASPEPGSTNISEHAVPKQSVGMLPPGAPLRPPEKTITSRPRNGHRPIPRLTKSEAPATFLSGGRAGSVCLADQYFPQNISDTLKCATDRGENGYSPVTVLGSLLALGSLALADPSLRRCPLFTLRSRWL